MNMTADPRGSNAQSSMDFKDGRSMKVVLVAHCVLNQNARLARCAERPAAVTELIDGLMDREVGIVQMPCPELIAIGLDREGVPIRHELDLPRCRADLRRMAGELVRQIVRYRGCGVRVLGVLGKNGSPACGVERTHDDMGFREGMGAFVEELAAELKAQGVSIPLAGILDDQPAAALRAVDEWLGPGD